MSYIGDGGGRPVLDTYIETLAQLRDEGFRRLWSSQLPSEPDLLTLLAVALRELDAMRSAAPCCRFRSSIRRSWHSAR
jgi:hypothetical protein